MMVSPFFRRSPRRHGGDDCALGLPYKSYEVERFWRKIDFRGAKKGPKLFFAVCVIKNEIDFCGPGGDVVGSRMWAGPSALLKRKAEPQTDEDTGCPFEPS